MEDILLTWMRASRGRQFDLIIAGRHSGMHGWKWTHLPIAFQVIDSTIVIHFDGSERLAISDAAGVAVRDDGELQVRDASEVRFSWCSEKDSAKEREEVFRKVGNAISFHRTDDLYSTSAGLVLFENNFVVLRSL